MSDHIGPDPIKWIDRLREVNLGSSFTDEQKFIIDVELIRTREVLIRSNEKEKR